MLVENDYEVKKLTSFKVGGKIQKVFFPENLGEFATCLQQYPDAFVCGNMTNTLVSTDGYDGVLILTTKMTGYSIEGTKVTAECGLKGPKLSQAVAEKGLSGLEFMVAFPGTIGGEVFMNAGAHGQMIKDAFVSGKFFDREQNKIIMLNKEEMEFSYRTSICQKHNLTVLSADFELTEKPVEDIKALMKENLEFRHTHQPSLALPNCGSVFRNPEGNSAGRLLEEAGAKSFTTGGARVWENHANFIINDSTATSTDILELMLKMQQAVKENSGISLMPEVRYLGNKNKKEEDICKILYQNLVKM